MNDPAPDESEPVIVPAVPYVAPLVLDVAIVKDVAVVKLTPSTSQNIARYPAAMLVTLCVVPLVVVSVPSSVMPPVTGADDAHVVPFEVSTFPLVPGATT